VALLPVHDNGGTCALIGNVRQFVVYGARLSTAY